MWRVEIVGVILPQGFAIMANCDHFIYLFFGKKMIAVFSTSGITPGEVIAEVEKHRGL